MNVVKDFNNEGAKGKEAKTSFAGIARTFFTKQMGDLWKRSKF